MAVYRSRNALAGPLTPDRLATVTLPLTPLGRRGYRPGDVDALLHRLAYELHHRIRERDQALAENQRIKNALRAWQSDRTTARREYRDGPAGQPNDVNGLREAARTSHPDRTALRSAS